MTPFAEHHKKCARLIEQLARARVRSATIRLAKSTSNLFRHREQSGIARIDVRAFNRVLHIDREKLLADVEGMTTYEDFVEETLRHRLLPTVVPQLKTITVGGAVSGIGIESSSFRFGLVHETVEEMEILLGDGSIVVCSRNQNEDLFLGFPNSYGTLGYLLRLKVRLIAAKRYVHVTHSKFAAAADYFAHIAELSESDKIDYLDGAIFGADEMVLTTGELCKEAPRVSDYTYMRIYYQSIHHKQDDWLTTRGYIWRWDTDWFWCSKHFGVQNPVIRLLATKWALNSRTYQRIMRLSHRLMPGSVGAESVIQDVDIPIGNATAFLQFLLAEIGITPVWICPFKAYDPRVTYDLYSLDPDRLYINFGFWDTVPSTHGDGYFNKKVERKTLELEGKKSLYSTSYYDEQTFWSIYNRPRYAELKNKYDSGGVFGDLYAKCVLRR